MTENTSKYDIAIVIPSYNQAGYIRNLLNSLENQQTQYSYQVIVVDSGSDESAAIVEQEFDWVSLVKLSERAHPGKGRNAGIEHAESDRIAFTDCDCIVSPDWIEQMVDSLKKYKVITGPVYNGTPNNIFGTMDYLLEFYDFWDFANGKKDGPVGSCNLSFQKSVYDEFGPLDENIKGSDARFTRKILKNNVDINWVPGMSIHHHNRTQFRKILKNQAQLGKGAVVTSVGEHKYGSILMKYKFLIPLIPFVRSLRIGRILAKKTMSNFFKFLLLFPLILVGLAAYAYGFARAAFKIRSDKQ